MATLTDDIAAAEARARWLVLDSVRAHIEEHKEPHDRLPGWVEAHPLSDCSMVKDAADCLAAVCRLAGRWESRQIGAIAVEIADELARLMEGL